MTKQMPTSTRLAVCGVLGAAGLAFAGAAAAQSDVQDQITVYGAPSPYDDHPMISQPVSYRDLDLSTEAGAAELRWRVAQTARSLCSTLGERPEREQNTTVLPSCQAAARDSAYGGVHEAITNARYYRGSRY